tara:strand:- start:959 stop:2803 length:1845 start_codon:yes stop_codon:yes gene_type:complete
LTSNSIWFNSDFVNNTKEFWNDCPLWLKKEILYDSNWKSYNYFMELTGLKTKFLSREEYVSTLHSVIKDKQIPYPYSPYKTNVITQDGFRPAIEQATIEKNLKSPMFTWDKSKGGAPSDEGMRLHDEYMKDNYSDSDWVGLLLYTIKRSVTTPPKPETIHRRTVWLSKIIAKILGHNEYAKDWIDANDRYRSTTWGGVKTGGFAFSTSAIFTLDFLHFVEYNGWQINYPDNQKLEIFNHPKYQENRRLYSIEDVFDESVYSEGRVGYIDSNSKVGPTKNPRLTWISDLYCNNKDKKFLEGRVERFDAQKEFIKSQTFYEDSAIWKIHKDYRYKPLLQKKMYVPIPFVSNIPYGGKYVFINWLSNPLAKTIQQIREEAKRKRLKQQNEDLYTNVEKKYHNQKNADKYYNYILENTKYHINHALTESNHSVKNRNLNKSGIYLNRGILYEIHNYVVENLSKMNYREDEGGGHIKGGHYNIITLADILGVISHLPLKTMDTTDARRLNEVYILTDKWINENIPQEKQVKKRPQSLNSYLTADRTALNRFLSFTGDITPHIGEKGKAYPNMLHIKDKRLPEGQTSKQDTIYLIYPAVRGSSRGNKNYFLPKWLFVNYQ